MTIEFNEQDLEWLDRKLRNEFITATWQNEDDIIDQTIRLGRTELAEEMKSDSIHERVVKMCTNHQPLHGC